ncbi:aldehyde dehydrogenase family protein [Kangiella sp. TOML190]|uniref:aldehyde dehydrogenase family protein n=1 Tax=Kangiella sp. TOML190 TaxID=2931351 RepID=UPI00203E493D|nr:aldehyde dehydrogenase family protein [Kangiella sp. TOML190]
MMQHGVKINSKLPQAGTLTVVNPYDLSPIAEIATVGEQHLDDVLSSAEALYLDKDNWMTVHQRVQILQKAAEIIRSRVEDLTNLAASEGGKPYLDSKVEVNRAIDGCQLAIEVIRNEHGDLIPMGGDQYSANRAAFTLKEPIGVVVAVSAFNHPLNLIIHQVIAAVAAGCPVIVKPASDTPLSCIAVRDILIEAGLPEAWCQVFISDKNSTATQLVTDPRVSFFSFIGSAKVGWMLKSKLAAGTRSALEHGGVAPAIVYPDANYDNAINLLGKGGFYHAGQVCVSVQRIYLQKGHADAFVAGLKQLAEKLVVGDPLSDATEVGPLIRPKECDRVHEWVTQAVKAGAKLITGGNKISDTCYQPTILLNPPLDAQVSEQEVFGPVICIYEVEQMEQAVQLANSLEVSFQAAVFTTNLDNAFYVRKHINASALMVNDHTAFRVDGMPFAGLKESGYGTGGIPYTIHDMQVDKMMVIKSPNI